MVTQTAATADTQTVDGLRSELVRQIQACNLELPLLPQVAVQLLTATADGRSDAGSVAALIHADQALAGHVLRIANSAYFAPTSPVVSLRQAVARLGFDSLVAITIAASAKDRVYRVPGFEAEAQWLWRHAFASSLWAKEIARMQRRNVETAFLCGLLHNIGKPVVLRRTVELIRRGRLKVAREAVLGLMEELNGQAGALLAVKWSLPRAVVESIVYCASGRGQPQHADEARTARLSDLLALLLIEPERTDEEAVHSDPMVAELNLYPEDLAELLERREQLGRIVEAMPL